MAKKIQRVSMHFFSWIYDCQLWESTWHKIFFRFLLTTKPKLSCGEIWSNEGSIRWLYLVKTYKTLRKTLSQRMLLQTLWRNKNTSSWWTSDSSMEYLYSRVNTKKAFFIYISLYPKKRMRISEVVQSTEPHDQTNNLVIEEGTKEKFKFLKQENILPKIYKS